MNLAPAPRTRTAEIARRIKAGERPADIAAALGITEQAVSKARKRAGLPKAERALCKTAERLRDERDLLMLKLNEEGRTHLEVAMLTGQTRCTVVAKINKIKKEMEDE